MERADRAPVATFLAPGDWGAAVVLEESAAHHALVKRLGVGDCVRVVSGDGRSALGEISVLAKRQLQIALTAGHASVAHQPAPPDVTLWAPVGDRDRMLWMAEKCTEIGFSAWSPVVYQRSRSVNPRGEGAAFAEKTRLRMVAALEQSGGAWLPAQYAERELAAALAAMAGDEGCRGLLLDTGGEPVASVVGALAAAPTTPIALALGPEGGLQPDERQQFVSAGWQLVTLGPNILRFETAAVSALALIRALTS